MRDDQIVSYLSLTGSDLEARATKFRAMLAAGKRDLNNYFLAETDGVITAGVRVERLHDHLALLVGPFLHPALPSAPAALSEMMQAVFSRARGMNTAQIGTRLMAGPMQSVLAEILASIGLRDCGSRIEFRHPVADLPDDTGTPLTWQTIAEIGEAQAAAMLSRASEGDPHGLEPDDDPAVVIAGYRTEAGLSNGPECIQIGALDGEPVAFVCAQVAPSDGWSRITYMGLIRSARGRRLGRWVHRRGFTMLRSQGGLLYHGGTAGENPAMLHLFRSHGCTEYRRMSEWLWIRPIEPAFLLTELEIGESLAHELSQRPDAGNVRALLQAHALVVRDRQRLS